MSLFRTTEFALWYSLFPALSFSVSLRSWYSSAKKYWIQSTFVSLWDFSSIPFRYQCILCNLITCLRVWRLVVIDELHPIIDSLELFIYWQRRVNHIVHLTIAGFKDYGRDIPVLIEHMPEEIAARDFNKYGVIIIKLLKVRVFDGVYDLVL